MTRNSDNSAISVIVPTFNRSQWLPQSIASVLHQTCTDFEIIIVNDHSSDTTRDILDALNDPRIRVNHLSENQGVARARNIAAKMARGEYLAILDANDIALPDRLRIQTEFMSSHPEISLVGSYLRLESEMGDCSITRRPKTHDAIVQSASAVCPIINTTIMMRKSAFDFVGGYPEAFRRGEDYRFFATMMKHFKVENIPDVLVVKRETSGGLTFKISPWRHFIHELSCRFFIVKELNLPFYHYLKAFVASLGILAVRWLGLNRERFKPLLQKKD